MKTFTAALLASVFVAGPALACGFGKSANMKANAYTASLEEKAEEAMTTFDPKEVPLFEEKTKKAEDETTVEPVSEEVVE